MLGRSPLRVNGMRYRRSSVLRGLTLIGSLVALFLAAPAVAATPQFVLVTKSGGSESLSYFGYSFGASSPPLGKPGTIEVDCKAPEEAALKKALRAGTQLTSAELQISAQLPHPQHFSYRFSGAKVKAIDFVTGHYGPTAAITLSFTSLSK